MSIGDSIRPRTESQFCDECPTLLAHHFDQLHTGSGISIDVIKKRGYKSILSKKELAQLGFSPSQQRVPGLLMPVWSPSGRNSNHQYRPDSPRLNRNGESIKYETPKGARIYRLSRHWAYGNSPASRQYTCAQVRLASIWKSSFPILTSVRATWRL